MNLKFEDYFKMLYSFAVVQILETRSIFVSPFVTIDYQEEPFI